MCTDTFFGTSELFMMSFNVPKIVVQLSRYLESINCEGLIVRPDRFVLASIKNLKDVRLVTKRNLKLLI